MHTIRPSFMVLGLLSVAITADAANAGRVSMPPPAVSNVPRGGVPINYGNPGASAAAAAAANASKSAVSGAINAGKNAVDSARTNVSRTPTPGGAGAGSGAAVETKAGGGGKSMQKQPPPEPVLYEPGGTGTGGGAAVEASVPGKYGIWVPGVGAGGPNPKGKGKEVSPEAMDKFTKNLDALDSMMVIDSFVRSDEGNSGGSAKSTSSKAAGPANTGTSKTTPPEGGSTRVAATGPAPTPVNNAAPADPLTTKPKEKLLSDAAAADQTYFSLEEQLRQTNDLKTRVHEDKLSDAEKSAMSNSPGQTAEEKKASYEFQLKEKAEKLNEQMHKETKTAEANRGEMNRRRKENLNY